MNPPNDNKESDSLMSSKSIGAPGPADEKKESSMAGGSPENPADKISAPESPEAESMGAGAGDFEFPPPPELIPLADLPKLADLPDFNADLFTFLQQAATDAAAAMPPRPPTAVRPLTPIAAVPPLDSPPSPALLSLPATPSRPATPSPLQPATPPPSRPATPAPERPITPAAASFSAPGAPAPGGPGIAGAFSQSGAEQGLEDIAPISTEELLALSRSLRGLNTPSAQDFSVGDSSAGFPDVPPGPELGRGPSAKFFQEVHTDQADQASVSSPEAIASPPSPFLVSSMGGPDSSSLPPADAAPSGPNAFQYVQDVASYCFSCLGHWKMAEAATTAVMLNALRASHRLAELRTPEKMKEVIDQIARDVCVDMIRRHLANPFSSSFASSPAEGLQKGPGDSPEREWILFNIKRLVIIEKIAEPSRSILKLRLWCERSFEEIGKALGKTETSVISIYSSALKQFKAALEKEEIPLPEKEETLRRFEELPLPVFSDDRLLPSEILELQASLHHYLCRPIQQVQRKALVQVAQMALATGSMIAGRILSFDGPFDLLPARMFSDLSRAPLGESPLRQAVNDAIFGDFSIIAGPNTNLVIEMAGGCVVFLGPSDSIIVQAPKTEGDCGSIAILKGQVACLHSAGQDCKLHVDFPGGFALLEDSDCQFAALSATSTRIEVFSGKLKILCRKIEVLAPPNHCAVCTPQTPPKIFPLKTRRPDTISWIAPYLRQESLPKEIQRRIGELLTPDAPEEEMRQAAAVLAPKSIKARLPPEPAPAPRKKPLWIAAAAIPIILLLVWKVFLSAPGGGKGTASWMSLLARERKAALGLLSSTGETVPLAFRFITRNGDEETILFDQWPYPKGNSDSGEERIGPLTRPEYDNNFSIALDAMRRSRQWSRTDEELANEFWKRVQAHQGRDMAMLTPGIPLRFWEMLLPKIGGIESFSLKPLKTLESPNRIAIFEAAVSFANGKIRIYQTAVARDEQGDGRPYIDMLASQWE